MKRVKNRLNKKGDNMPKEENGNLVITG